MTRAIQRLTLGLLAAFAITALALGYWVAGQGSALLARDDNPRRVLAEQRIQRGQILDRHEAVLADSQADPASETIERDYAHPEAAPVVGYYSLRYGVGGIEAEYDSFLRGEAWLTPIQQVERSLLHQPLVGGDVMLTLDLSVQRAAMQALAGKRGAVTVLTTPTGDVLALASSPTFDANQLEESWDDLVANPDAPLVNRATQGAYQPGTILQSVILGAALNTGVSTPEDEWSGPLAVPVDGRTLPCVHPAVRVQTLGDAYVAACPAPYQAVAERIGAHRLDTALFDFGLLEPPPFVLPVEAIGPDAQPSQGDLARTAVGQSELTVNPLQMALVAAAFSNNGQIPPLRLVAATRQPGGPWREAAPSGNPRGTISRSSVETVMTLMAQAARRSGVLETVEYTGEVFGHAGLAVAGPEDSYNAWFIGFAYRAEGEAVAVAVLLEDTPDAQAAARIGGEVLSAALAAQP